jgi:hypothetical protein
MLIDDGTCTGSESLRYLFPPVGDRSRVDGSGEQCQVGARPGARRQQADLILVQFGAAECRQAISDLGRRHPQVTGIECLLGETGMECPGQPRILRGFPERRSELGRTLCFAPAHSQLQLQQPHVTGHVRRRLVYQFPQQAIGFIPLAGHHQHPGEVPVQGRGKRGRRIGGAENLTVIACHPQGFFEAARPAQQVDVICRCPDDALDVAGLACERE